jgi:L-alanine-DL-glutamate epimerase-like enolase superfamily enzyme
MTIVAAEAFAFDAPLTRPYAIASGSADAVEMAFVVVRDAEGREGFGMASPAEEVTGETRDAALLSLRRYCDNGFVPVGGPGARAAIDMAAWDLAGKRAGKACIDLLGRVQPALPTSITIGVKDVAATLAEAAEYLARGFAVLKVKVGVDVDVDVERLAKLRERHGRSIVLRADGNQGYDERALLRFLAATRELDLEMIEQPMPPGSEAFLATLPAAVRTILCADESVHDAEQLAAMTAAGCPYGIVNIKLQKCGGPGPARALAIACERLGLGVMWGCNDESVLGIAAALHVALACRATRYLDLDGSLDLSADAFAGGFVLRAGMLDTLPLPGLGVLRTDS